MEVALLASALVVGCLLAVQAAVNQQLNKAVGTPYGASTLQLSVAAAALAAVALAAGALGAARQVTEVEHWWLLVGGVASPVYITAGILLFPRLGALNTVGLFVTGQVFASTALDLFGILAVPQQAVGPGILLGAAAVLAGITVTIRGLRTGAVATVQRAARPGWLALGVVAGAVLPFQGAINAQLKRDIGEPLAVGTISFVVATLTIAAVLLMLVLLRRTPAPRVAPLRVMPWWGWLGGLCAATYVTATFLLLPRIGAAVTVALTVTGQQLASALIDQYGWFRMPQRATTGPRMLGLGLLVAGSALVQLA
jgi:transporter family-2 protein